MAEEKKTETETKTEAKINSKIFALRTTANREDQVMDFVSSNAPKKKLAVHSIIRAHGMRGYIFVEAATKQDAEQACFNVPYARGILPKEIDYSEIEHMLEQIKVEMNIQKNDIVEIISGPFKREEAKVTRIDKSKEEVVVELLEAAVPIPITLKMDAIKVIRRESEDEDEETEEEVPIMEKPEEEAPEEDGGKDSGKLPMPPQHMKGMTMKSTMGELVEDPDDIIIDDEPEKEKEDNSKDKKDKKKK